MPFEAAPSRMGFRSLKARSQEHHSPESHDATGNLEIGASGSPLRGRFEGVHRLAFDSTGSLYAGEICVGGRKNSGPLLGQQTKFPIPDFILALSPLRKHPGICLGSQWVEQACAPGEHPPP